MRANFLFLVLWVLLVLSRGSDMAYSYSQYRLEHKLQADVGVVSDASGRGRDKSENLIGHEAENLSSARTAGLELLALVGICFLFFRVQRGTKKVNGS